MAFRLTSLILSLASLVCAQTPPKAAPAKTSPPKAAAKAKPRATPEQALRTRVTQFLQHHVDGNFRKAMDMVAEDTQEQYFVAGKQRLKTFKIDSVKLSENNTRAVVNSTITRDWQVRMNQHEVVVPMVTTWKVEKGLWVWYWNPQNAWLTPMGPSNIEPPSKNPDGTIKLPPNMNADVVAAAARNILSQSSVDRNEVVLKASSEEQVWFTNAVQGSVRVAVLAPPVPGLEATVDKPDVAANSKAAVTFRYRAAPDAELPEPVVVQIVTEPLNQGYPVKVTFIK